jgi:hypothetical protein
MKSIKLIATSLVITSLFLLSMVRSVRAKSKPADIAAMTGACGTFLDKNWMLDVGNGRGSSYTYSMKNYRTKKDLILYGGKIARANGKHYYKWNNRGTIYQVTWKPSDPEYARVEAFDRGKQVFNQLLKLDYSDCD